jgi:putative membrane protein
MLHANNWSLFGMHFFWWLFWIGLIVTTFSTVTPVPKSQMKSGERALDILRRRYAAGQISSEDYEKRKGVLERDEPGTVPAARSHQHG